MLLTIIAKTEKRINHDYNECNGKVDHQNDLVNVLAMWWRTLMRWESWRQIQDVWGMVWGDDDWDDDSGDDDYEDGDEADNGDGE